MYLSLVAVSPHPIVLRAARGAIGPVVADLLLAFAFAATWLCPGLLGAESAPALATTLVLEFFVIHAAAFLGVAAVAPFPAALRSAIVVVLGAVYLVILWPLAAVTGLEWLRWAFWALLLNRLWALAEPALALELRSSQPLQDEWLKVGLLSVGLAVVTAALPVPALGFASAGADVAVPLAGFGIPTPAHAMALGAMYFGINAWRRLQR